MSTNDDGLGPTRNKSGNVLDDDGFSEHCSIEDVSDCSVGRLPHLFQLEFSDSFLVRSDGGTLDTYFVLLDSMSSINGDLIVSLVSVFNAQVVVFDINIQIRKDVLKILDEMDC